MRFSRWPHWVATSLVLLLALPFGAQAQQAAAPAAPAPKAERKNVLLGAKSWAYQLTNLGEAQRKRIADSSYDLVVVDYAWEYTQGGPEFPLTREQVAAMQKKPDGSKRLIIAYLSIGETENNRYYWKPEWNSKRPAWMGKENKDWKGNYLVQYWQPVWQNIIFGNPQSYVDKIIAAGFDGFYLDRGDAYYFYGDTKQSRDRMSDFMIRLIAYIRTKQPEAGILAQNAEELLERPDYVDAIDGIAKEDLQFGIKHREELNKADEITWSNNLLKGAQKKGKAIFVVEYLQQPGNIEKAKAFMKEQNYVLYYGPRGLFEIQDPNAPPRTAPAGAVSKSEPKPGPVKKIIRAIRAPR
jgi:cysteinyl-tRNA synthetase, unknown class